MNRNLFDIDAEYLDILEQFEFAETDEEIKELERRLAQIDGEHERKAENYCKLIKSLKVSEKEAEAQRKVFTDLAKEWADKRDARKNKADRIAEVLRQEKDRLGFGKRKYGNFSTWSQDYDSLEITDEVPAEYRKPGDPNTALIKEEIEAGVELDFAKINTTTKLQVR